MTDITQIPDFLRRGLQILEEGCRRTGRTTRMIKDAPQGAIIVCSSEQIAINTRVLAKEMSRGDLRVMSLDPGQLYGLRGNLIFDHDYIQKYWLDVIEREESRLQLMMDVVAGPKSGGAA